MLHLVRGLGALVAGMGVLFFLFPPLMPRFLAWVREGNRVYGIGAFRLAAGLMLLAAAPQCGQPAVAAVLAGIFLLSAAAVFMTGPERMAGLFLWWGSQPEGLLRLMGLIAMMFGLLIYVVA